MAEAQPPNESLKGHLRQGKLLMEKEDRRGAGAGFAKVLSLRARNESAYIPLALALWRAGDLPKAAETLRRALAFEPRDPSPLYYFGRVLAEPTTHYRLLCQLQDGQMGCGPDGI